MYCTVCSGKTHLTLFFLHSWSARMHLFLSVYFSWEEKKYKKIYKYLALELQYYVTQNKRNKIIVIMKDMYKTRK